MCVFSKWKTLGWKNLHLSIRSSHFLSLTLSISRVLSFFIDIEKFLLSFSFLTLSSLLISIAAHKNLVTSILSEREYLVNWKLEICDRLIYGLFFLFYAISSMHVPFTVCLILPNMLTLLGMWVFLEVFVSALPPRSNRDKGDFSSTKFLGTITAILQLTSNPPAACSLRIDMVSSDFQHGWG